MYKQLAVFREHRVSHEVFLNVLTRLRDFGLLAMYRADVGIWHDVYGDEGWMVALRCDVQDLRGAVGRQPWIKDGLQIKAFREHLEKLGLVHETDVADVPGCAALAGQSTIIGARPGGAPRIV